MTAFVLPRRDHGKVENEVSKKEGGMVEGKGKGERGEGRKQTHRAGCCLQALGRPRMTLKKVRRSQHLVKGLESIPRPSRAR